MSRKKATKFLNRELSWLEFNQRVLDEACDVENRLLERLKFLAITASNLDEFFMVRVGGLQAQVARGNSSADPSGMTPQQMLDAIGDRTHQMLDQQYRCLLEDLEPQLAAANFMRLSPAKLSDRQKRDVKQIFENEIFSVLTPMAVTCLEDFPLLVNQTLSVCACLEPTAGEKEPRFAIIPFGRGARRFYTLSSDGGYAFIMLEDIVEMFIDRFFEGQSVQHAAAFRITRNADFSVAEDSAPDLLSGMEEVLAARKQSHCVRLEIAAGAGATIRDFLQGIMQISGRDIFDIPGPLDLSAFMQIIETQGFDDLRIESWPPQPSPAIDLTASIFETLARRDVLLYHPYESFDPVVKLLNEAADDPDVIAIKQTLYRTSRSSPIVAALQRAAENGKHVTAIIELKARFDEARNIEWAKNLERTGVQVIYGVKGLKTHSKVCIVVRREPHGIQRYLHFGTGNYNDATAKIYSDVSYMTANEELGADAISFFNAITGYSQPQAYRKIEAAPTGLRDALLEMIETETQRKRQGQKAHIAAKLNSLVDPKIINALYDASQAGVKVKLNIRGICCLRPGVEGLSENISVISIVDRFLEHARILYFYHGGDERVFISSADWMPRNLDSRVELLVPVEDRSSRRRLIEILECYFRDTVKARRLLPDGGYEAIKPVGRRKKFRSQEWLYQQAKIAVKQAEQSRRTVFEPHRSPLSTD